MHQPTLEDKVRALTDPGIYSSAVRKIETTETHFAWLFFTGGYAYKLKKPLRLDRMDHTSIEARHKNCCDELRLNRRLAPAVYLDVTPLRCDLTGALHFDGDGAIVDWLVKMRRLPQELLLDRAIEAHDVSRLSIQSVGLLLAEFYRRQETVEFSPEEYGKRIKNQVSANKGELLAGDLGLPSELVNSAFAKQMEILQRCRPLLGRRAEQHKIVEAHGDLRPEHVYIGTPPCIIDCLEFDRDLRLLDPLEELAFFSMECARLGAEWIGQEVLNVYVGASGDECSTALFSFYMSHRAAHRAVIAAWHLRDPQVRDDHDWRAHSADYLELAMHYASHAVN